MDNMKTAIRCIDGKWYAFGLWKNDSVVSIGRDNPVVNMWCARYCDNGIKFCASPSPNRKAAVAKARRHGEYVGER